MIHVRAMIICFNEHLDVLINHARFHPNHPDYALVNPTDLMQDVLFSFSLQIKRKFSWTFRCTTP